MDLTGLIERGGTNPVLLFVLALALGALHGLEPGHSKTMMAAYIIAIHGTVKQAALLGISAALSHSLIVWALAIVALSVGNELIGEDLEPWFMMVSGLLVLGIAAWMLRTVLRSATGDPAHVHHTHGHGSDHIHDHAHLARRDDVARLQDGEPGSNRTGASAAASHLDAHAQAHAAEIRERLAAGRTGSWQTILFGLSGGLIPCPAAITVFILCLHLGKVALGLTLVSAFSVGLALTLVAVGVVAALGVQALSTRTSRFDAVIAAAPWLSAALVAAIGALIFWSGYAHLTAHGSV